MTYPLVVRRQAKADIREAARWYERQRGGLGRAFVQQIDALLDRVRLNPMQHQIVHREVRRAIPRRFPTACFTESTDPRFSCLPSLICIAIRPSGRIAKRAVKANNRLERPARRRPLSLSVLRTCAVSNPSHLERNGESDSMPRWTSGTSSIRKPDRRTSTDTPSPRTMSRMSFVGRSRTDPAEKARGSPWGEPRRDGTSGSSMWLIRFPTRFSLSPHTRLVGGR